MPRLNRYQKIAPVSAANATSSAMSPVVKLTTLERSIFNLTIERNPHLRPADVVLTTCFAQQAARVLRAKNDSGLEKATRALIALGRSLRLTASSVVEPKTAGRMRRDARIDPVDELLAEDDDDGNED